MKKIIAFALALCLSFAFGCVKKPAASDTPGEPATDGSAASPAEILWSEYTFTESYSDEQVSPEPLVNLNVSLPLISNREEINHYYDDLATELRALGESYLKDAKENLTYASQNNGIFSPYTVETSFNVTRNDGKVFAVVHTLYENTGGAHPNSVTSCENFDVYENALLTVNDVFSVPFDAAADVLKPIVWDLMDKRGEETGMGGDMYFPNAKNDLFELWDKKDFYFTDTALVLIWQNYCLAPYAAGIQYFEIPFTPEVLGILNAEWVPAS